MHRGRRIEPHKECEFCNKPLPALRHPGAKYCDPICRGRARWALSNESKGVKCRICGKLYKRVGSHAVQVHGYESTLEYRREFGLMARETHTEEHAAEMRAKAVTLGNLEKGAPRRYRKGGDHGQAVKAFWRNRERKLGTRARHIPENSEKLGGEREVV